MRGRIYDYDNITFHDSVTHSGNKLVVVLNYDHGDNVIVCALTTSKQHTRLNSSGCCSVNYCYKIDANVDFFKLDTWILINNVYEFSKAEFLNKVYRGDVRYKHKLKSQTIDAIRNCCSVCPDISIDNIKRIVTQPAPPQPVAVVAAHVSP